MQTNTIRGITQKRFAGRVVIVTGASSGLGLATTWAFVSEGAKVVLAARDKKRLDQAVMKLQKEGWKDTLPIPCDVSKREDVDNLVAKTIGQFGRIDILINNAGIAMIAPFECVQIKDAVSLFETNVFGAMNCIQAVLPYMKQQRKGHIINIASVGGLRGIPNISVYSASKAALISLSDALRIELKQFGIAVTVVCSGRIKDTLIFERAIKYGPIKLYEVLETLTTKMVAQVLLNGTEKRKRMVIVPFQARLLYTVNKLAPRVIDHLLYKRMPKLDIIETKR